jgi:hypothetical protein
LHLDRDRIVWQRHPEEGCCWLEGVIVPMCQSPKIADVLLHTGKIPANDNRAPVKKNIKVGQASLFRAACQTLLIFGCAVALLLL